jgi:hypothetical protein
MLKKVKKEILCAECSRLRAEGFSCSLDIPFKLQFLIKKYQIYIFCPIFSHQNSGTSIQPKMLNPDPEPKTINSDPRHLFSLLFLEASILVFLVDEPLFLIHHIDIMVSVTGSNLLQNIKESLQLPPEYEIIHNPETGKDEVGSKCF